VQQKHHWTIGGARFRVTDIEDPGLDLLQRAERRVGPGLDRVELAGLRPRDADPRESGGRDAQRRGAQKAAATMVDLFGYVRLSGMGQSEQEPEIDAT